jgi:hypothetical protein
MKRLILLALIGLMLACSRPCVKNDLLVQDYKALAEQAQLRYEIAKKTAIQRCKRLEEVNRQHYGKDYNPETEEPE